VHVARAGTSPSAARRLIAKGGFLLKEDRPMRTVHKTLTLLGLFVVGAAVQGVACANTDDDCALIGTACPGQTPTTTATGGGNQPDGGSLCDQSPKDNPDAVSDTCGVFAKSGAAAGGTGSMQSPVATLAAAVDAAVMQKKRHIYACVGAFTEIVTVPAGITLYGGLDCENGWAVTEGKTSLKGTPDMVPLTLAGGAGQTRVENFEVVAVDAAMGGGSSIAALAQDGSTVHFENSKLTAGNAQKGADGATSENSAPMAPSMSEAGKAACDSTTMNAGANQNLNDCMPDEDVMLDELSIGGFGGMGLVQNSTPGVGGSADPMPETPAGDGGSNLVACASGGDGKAGANGADGDPGTAGLGAGSLDAVVGWVGASGGDGKKGKPGQGGGGGRGQAGKTGTPACAGASGGAGGAGGCGGWGGTGGKAGGSSIALVSINATITMVNVVLSTGKAGDGGVGGMNQVGASGGLGGGGGAGKTVNGTPLPAGCKGGAGGLGGRGGPGGGGAGGHSLGVAYMGQGPTVDKVEFAIMTSNFGAGGLGGDNNSKGNGGEAGQAKNTLEFMPADL
jgi:hypothetical protein